MTRRTPASTRWVVGFVAALGLLVMHGLTASTATAAGCGGVPAHVESHASHHEGMSGALAIDGATVTSMGVAPLGGAGDMAMLCVAILLMGIVLGLAASASRRMQPARVARRSVGRPSTGTRAPPERADLSVWRN